MGDSSLINSSNISVSRLTRILGAVTVISTLAIVLIAIIQDSHVGPAVLAMVIIGWAFFSSLVMDITDVPRRGFGRKARV